MTAISHMTAEELLASPQYEKHCELVKGELIMMAPAGGGHGRITHRVVLRVGNFIDAQKRGEGIAAETGFLLSRDPDTVRAPDFAFIPSDRIPPGGIGPKFITVVPGLVIEVLSPGDSAMAVAEKIDDWAAFGVDEIWVVNPKLKTVTVHLPGKDPHTLRMGESLAPGGALTGLTLPVADIFN